MRRKSKVQPAARSEFAFHLPTRRVGLVTGVSPAGGETHTTLQLAGGDLVSAPSVEFRPATGPEIESYHRLAASVHPFTLPPMPMSRPSLR